MEFPSPHQPTTTNTNIDQHVWCRERTDIQTGVDLTTLMTQGNTDDFYYQYNGCAWLNAEDVEDKECTEYDSDNGDQGNWVQMSYCYRWVPKEKEVAKSRLSSNQPNPCPNLS